MKPPHPAPGPPPAPQAPAIPLPWIKRKKARAEFPLSPPPPPPCCRAEPARPEARVGRPRAHHSEIAVLLFAMPQSNLIYFVEVSRPRSHTGILIWPINIPPPNAPSLPRVLATEHFPKDREAQTKILTSRRHLSCIKKK